MDFNSIIAKRVRDKDPQGYGIIAQLGAVSYTHLDVYKRQALMDWLTADWEMNSSLEASEKLRVVATK